MAAVTKLFLVLIAFVCCMQLVEMGRLRRDAPAANSIDELLDIFKKATSNFTETVEQSQVIKEVKEKLNNISPDDVKKVMEEVTKNTKDNLDKFKDFLNNVFDGVSKEVKHN